MNRWLPVAVVLAVAVTVPLAQGVPSAPPPAMSVPKDDARIDKLKGEAAADVEAMKDQTQQMVDSIFSFGELGFQEIETHRYVVDILKKNGFNVEEGVAGIPTAFMASWGSGKPVIALGSDIDGIPQASQKPGVAYPRRWSKGRLALLPRGPDQGPEVRTADSPGRQAGDRAEPRSNDEVPCRDAEVLSPPSRYKTYLEQLGITYPTVKK